MSYSSRIMDSNVSHVFRAIDYAYWNAPKEGELENKTSNDIDAQKKDTIFAELGEESAKDEKYKSGITKMLEDFSEKFKSFHGKNNSNISADDCKRDFFGKVRAWLGKPNDNIFESEAGQQELKDSGNVYQRDLFLQEINKNNGIAYAKDGYGLAQSALNFAKADIDAVEVAYDKANNDGDDNFYDGKLCLGEVKSYDSEYNEYDYSSSLFKKPQHFKEINLDNDGSSLTAQEYASYILVADANQDGIISGDEAYEVAKAKDSELQEKAQAIYDEYFKK